MNKAEKEHRHQKILYVSFGFRPNSDQKKKN